jgi:ubiquinone/menaquinone biosynthesis C-methylase UbiE
MSELGFKTMAVTFKIRDFLRPRIKIVTEAEISEGFEVLDFGCGPGSYVKIVSRFVGKSGKLYALDVNPVAIKMVKGIIFKNQLLNVETILSDGNINLPDSSFDRVLLYDVFHDISDSRKVLKELNRILKTDGVLSFSDHHLKEVEIVSRVTEGGFFEFLKKGEETFSFTKRQVHN